jgi:glycerol kinase
MAVGRGSSPNLRLVSVVIAIDCGTTGVRSFAVDDLGNPVGFSYREFTQFYPEPGWVEHDATEIWNAVVTTLNELMDTLPTDTAVAAIGITNQRETVVAWDRATGMPRHRAIVWQDRRTAMRCDSLRDGGHLDLVRSRTGLVLDPYFTGTKAAWLISHGGVVVDHDLLLGTVDSWVLWKLTGGTRGGVHATDPSNASRTLLYDIVERRWSEQLCDVFGVPMQCLPEVRPSVGRLGTVSAEGLHTAVTGVAVSGILGDQQSALFGQACLSPGMVKNTYGTGSFLLMNVGPVCPAPAEGILTTVAWDLGSYGSSGAGQGTQSSFVYALEGSVFVTGAAIQWLRDGLQIIGTAAEIGPLAASVESTNGAYIVPAFAGLGSPWWDPYARGTIVGLSRGVTRAHLARAVIEAIAYQVRDVVTAMKAASGTSPAELRVDGGASVMDLLLQMQADQLQINVARPKITETTALGAVYAAGLAEGVWSSVDEISAAWQQDAEFHPTMDPALADLGHGEWLRAVERSRGWATS